MAVLGGRGGAVATTRLLAEFPALAGAAARAPTRPPPCAAPARCGSRPARRGSGRVLLAGDAAGYVDALTGEGVAVGLATAPRRWRRSRPAGRRTTRRPGGGRPGATGWSATALLAVAAAPGPAPRPGPAGLGRSRGLRPGRRPGGLTRQRRFGRQLRSNCRCFMTPWPGAVQCGDGRRRGEAASARRPRRAPPASARPGCCARSSCWSRCSSAYRLGRLAIAGHDDLAIANAWQVWDVERLLHLPDEETLQDWVLQWPDLLKAANWYYVDRPLPGHAGLPGLGLAAPSAAGVPLGPPPDHHADRLRPACVHTAMPLAPPRMLSSLGFLDTMAAFGPSAYDGSAATVANQFAAMPSLHVGWALLIAVVVVRTARSRWRWLIVAHPVITTLVVVVHRQPLLGRRAGRRAAARAGAAGHAPAARGAGVAALAAAHRPVRPDRAGGSSRPGSRAPGPAQAVETTKHRLAGRLVRAGARLDGDARRRRRDRGRSPRRSARRRGRGRPPTATS